VCMLRPKSTGRVTLRSADPADPPKFFPNFLADEEDVRATACVVRHIRTIMSTEPIANRVVDEYLPGRAVRTEHQIVDYMASTGNTASHQAGTCRMGRDPMAVIDEPLRVRGVERLRVVDASVMPCLTSGNTIPATLTIGAKAPDRSDQDACTRPTCLSWW